MKNPYLTSLWQSLFPEIKHEKHAWLIGAWDVLWCQLCHVWYQPDMSWTQVRLEHNNSSDFPRSFSSKPGRKHPDCRACAIIGRKGYRSIFSWDTAMSGCSHFSNALPLCDMCWWLMAYLCDDRGYSGPKISRTWQCGCSCGSENNWSTCKLLCCEVGCQM